MLENLNKKQKIIVIFILILMILVIIYYVYTLVGNAENFNMIEEENSMLDNSQENLIEDNNISQTNNILVHVSGCVKKEGIVSLSEGSRINDAIESARRSNR